MLEGAGGVITRSFMVEKVAFAASGAWVGTTAACVICSIITFLAARLPNGLGVGSTTDGTGAAEALLALEGAGAAARGGGLTLAGALATALGAGAVTALGAGLEGLTTAGAAGLAPVLPAAAGLAGVTGTAFLAAAGWGAAALTAGLEEVLGAAGAAAFLATGAATGLAAGLVAAFAAGWTAGLATAFFATTALAAVLTAALLTTAGIFAWDACPLTAVVAVLVDFAVRVAGAFTRGLLSVPDEACSGGGTSRPLVAAVSGVVGDADPLVVIPRLRCATGERSARRLTAGLA